MISNFTNFSDYIRLDRSFSDVKYYDSDHSYKIGDTNLKYSVTRLLSKYKKPFDSKTMAKRIADREGVWVNDVLEKWDFERDYANHCGTEFHKFVENFLTRKIFSIDKKSLQTFFEDRPSFYSKNSIEDYYKRFFKLIQAFQKFYNEFYKDSYDLIKSEFVVGDVDYKISGTIDNLSFNRKTQKLCIIDYKTNKKIDFSSKYKDKLLPPLNHLDNCEYNIYSLQIWLYKIILEKNTGIELGDCKIIWFNQENFQIIDIANYKNEALAILNLQEKC